MLEKLQLLIKLVLNRVDLIIKGQTAEYKNKSFTKNVSDDNNETAVEPLINLVLPQTMGYGLLLKLDLKNLIYFYRI